MESLGVQIPQVIAASNKWDNNKKKELCLLPYVESLACSSTKFNSKSAFSPSLGEFLFYFYFFVSWVFGD